MSSKIVEIMQRDDSDPMKRLFIAAGGTYQAVGDLIGESRQNVANWFQRDQVPADHVVDICKALGDQIKPEELRPDVFK